MAPSPVLDLKAFVPAKDHALAKQFYLDLGFTLNWGNTEAAELQIGDYRFLLQKFHVEQFASNFMMHLMVADAALWQRLLSCSHGAYGFSI